MPGVAAPRVAPALFFLVATSGCWLGGPEVVREGDRVLIVDRRGERFDVTHAQAAYDMDPGGFQYGLGKGAIPAITAPTFLAAPANAPAGERVLGYVKGGDARAYRISKLRRHEVVDDAFAGHHVAVAY